PLDPTLTNPRSDRVKAVRALAGRPARSRHGQLLVEGPQGVRGAVRPAPTRVRDVYVTPTAASRHPETAGDPRDARLRRHVATAEVLAAMSPDAQGVLAVVRAEARSLADVAASLARPDRDRPALVAVLATV